MRHKCHKADDLMKAIEKVILHIRMSDVIFKHNFK